MLRARPWFSLHAASLGDGPGAGAAATSGDGLPPDLPGFHDVLHGASGRPAPLLAALRAAASALSLPAAIVLPALTSADLVALWRAAVQRWLEEEARAASGGIRLLAGPEAAPLLASLAAPPPEASLAYRDWLRRRLNWKPE
jgi:hypothetical protein